MPCFKSATGRCIFTVSAVVMALCTPFVSSPAFSIESASAQAATMNDFRPIVGGGWSGELEYLNFGRVDRSSIPVRMIVDEPSGNSLPYAFLYPGEADKNATETITLSADGRALDDLAVTARRVKPDGTVILVTEGQGSDDGKDVAVRVTYELHPQRFVVRKDIKRSDGTFFNRNEYRLSR